ncbi:MAG: hypothetical protein J6B63_03365 [Treponema sp.]|nr:hypothetical protein [Treponema sp.]MBQ7881498.1 hypothetical protein [Treponema sp.]
MTGYEKIAILLGELGVSTSEAILNRLNLSTEELVKIRKNIKALGGKYNPFDENQVARENAVLEEFKRYGEMRGIYKDVPHAAFIKTGESSVQNNVRNMAVENPEALAKVLSSWLSDKK